MNQWEKKAQELENAEGNGEAEKHLMKLFPTLTIEQADELSAIFNWYGNRHSKYGNQVGRTEAFEEIEEFIAPLRELAHAKWMGKIDID